MSLVNQDNVPRTGVEYLPPAVATASKVRRSEHDGERGPRICVRIDRDWRIVTIYERTLVKAGNIEVHLLVEFLLPLLHHGGGGKQQRLRRPARWSGRAQRRRRAGSRAGRGSRHG